MAADLVTPEEMALWTQTDLAVLNDDPFAAEVRAKVSGYVCFLAGHEDWTRDTAPFDVKVIALWMVKRTYTNPDQEVQTGVGPLSSRVLDEAALGMNLTDSERATLQGYKESASGGTGGLFIMSLAGRSPKLQPTVFIEDDQQVNLGNLDPWRIPFTDPNDVNHL